MLTNAAGCDSTVTLDLTINNSTTGTDVITACDSYTWIDGNTYTASNNTATFVLTNAAGCDSTVTLDLTINNSTAGTDVITACDSYTWIDGNTYTASNNTATFVLTNAAGCDSTVTLDLTINSIDVTTSLSGLTITANQTGATYQWVDCDNNYAPITGESNDNFTATTNGSYAVIISDGVCTDTSNCIVIDYAHISETGVDFEVLIYPNPSNGDFFVQTDQKDLELKVYALDGKLVLEKNLSKNTKEQFDLKEVGSGTYIAYVSDGLKQYFTRLVVK